MVAEKIRDGKANFGFNALTGQYQDMIKAGIGEFRETSRGAVETKADPSESPSKAQEVRC